MEGETSSSDTQQGLARTAAPAYASLLSRNADTFRKLGIYTVLMFAFPILVFMIVAYWLQDLVRPFGDPLILGGVFAVLAVNTVMAAYVYEAFKEDENYPSESGNMVTNEQRESAHTEGENGANSQERPSSPLNGARRRHK